MTRAELEQKLAIIDAELALEAVVISRHNRITEKLDELVAQRDALARALSLPSALHGGVYIPTSEEVLLPTDEQLTMLLDRLHGLNVDLAIEAAASVRIGRITDRMRQLATERDRVSHEIALADQARAGGHI